MISISRAMMAVLLLLSGAACDRAGSERQAETGADLVVSDARMTLPPPGRKMAAIYLRLQNSSNRDRHLQQVTAEIAGVAEVHRSVYEDGMVRMRQVPHPVVPAGQSLVFEPGGYHVMLMDLAPIEPGRESFELRLTFDGGETVATDVELLSPR